MLKGIDISHWQANLDIASTGAEFVIVKLLRGPLSWIRVVTGTTKSLNGLA